MNGTGVLNGVSGPLPPKLGKQSEVGLKNSLLGGKFTGTLSYFDVRQLNNTLPSVPFDPANPNVLIPGVISRGFDGDASFQATKNLYLIGSFSWFKAKSVLGPAAASFVQPYYRTVVTGSIPDNNTAQHALRALALYRFTQGSQRGLDVGLGIDYQSKKAVTDSANQVMFGYLPERTIVNANAVYTVSKRLKYSLNVDNLFNRRYLYSARNANQIVTGDPINIKLGVTYSR